MVIRNRATCIPVLIWTLMISGLFLLTLYQQRTGVDIVPHLSLSNAFGWVSSLLLLFFILFWPLSLEAMVERFARQPLSMGTFSVLALQEPLLLVLYTLPVLLVSAAFGFKGFSEILQTLLILTVVGLAIWAHFRLGFYFHGSMAKPFFLVAGILCVVVPAVNLVWPLFMSGNPAWLNNLNPFFALFAVAGPGEGFRTSFWVFFLVFGGLTIALLAAPFVMALPPRVYKDIAG